METLPGKIETNVPFSKLRLHPKNPNVGDVAAIAKAIQKNGWHGAVVAQVSTGYVLVGNHRLQAAKELKLKGVPIVNWVDVDDETANRILLADNRIADMHTFDYDKLFGLLQGLAENDPLEGLTGTGYLPEDLDGMLSWGGHSELADTDPAPATPSTGTDGIGTAGDTAPADPKERYAESGNRSLILELTIADYETAMTALSAIRKATGETTNTEVILRLIATEAETL